MMKWYLALIFVSLLICEVKSQCSDCTNFGFCADDYGNGTCAECVCPTYFSGECCETPSPDICTENPCTNAPASENWECIDLTNGQRECRCEEGWTGSKCDTEMDPCDAFPCFNGGTCQEDGKNGTVCKCAKDYSGTQCQDQRECTSSWICCTKTTCQNGGTCYETKTSPRGKSPYYNATCSCPEGFTGKNCETELCSSLVCNHGGICVVDSSGKEVCQCLSIWSGPKCDTFAACQFYTCYNGGTCSVVNNTATCTCVKGYAQPDCKEEINMCEPNPCIYTDMGVQNETTCTPLFNDFKCDCPDGTTGKDCSTNIPDCTVGRIPVCKNNATCLDGLNEYKCVCTPDYTGVNCTMSMIVWEVAQAFGGLDGIINLLEDVVTSPSLIKDLMPFLLGQQSKDNQSAMSWSYDDLFVWASYEKNELHENEDFVTTFDTTLGNCFTFNHGNCPKKYTSRKAGEDGGFKALMRVRQDQYLAWIDTASLLVFVHPPEETVFSESVRYSAAPNTSATVITQKNAYSRLNGKYGNCVHSISEVGSYYYNGSYTTSGCFRGCYQDVIFQECGCMDPRYAMADDIPACNITAWDCVNKVTEDKGDASTWPSCKCPSPCQESQFESAFATASFPSYYFPCDAVQNNTLKYGYCMGNYSDMVLISVYIPRLTQRVFAERPAMSLNAFISNVGGIAGVFIGFSVVTVFDFAFIFIYIGWALCGGGSKKKSDKDKE